MFGLAGLPFGPLGGSLFGDDVIPQVAVDLGGGRADGGGGGGHPSLGRRLCSERG